MYTQHVLHTYAIQYYITFMYLPVYHTQSSSYNFKCLPITGINLPKDTLSHFINKHSCQYQYSIFDLIFTNRFRFGFLIYPLEYYKFSMQYKLYNHHSYSTITTRFNTQIRSINQMKSITTTWFYMQT